ncbi:hypothetical protein [Hymenobacter sp. GOD-10R]|nr:hypothetical protein [Hymenobacter sp. GOD-10R]WRQ31970.1 hypothetical protein SD425_29595 [Hymenobacter sp. GOD-10R]
MNYKLLASGWTRTVVILLVLAALVNGFGILNTLVSLQYEHFMRH